MKVFQSNNPKELQYLQSHTLGGGAGAGAGAALLLPESAGTCGPENRPFNFANIL